MFYSLLSDGSEYISSGSLETSFLLLLDLKCSLAAGARGFAQGQTDVLHKFNQVSSCPLFWRHAVVSC